MASGVGQTPAATNTVLRSWLPRGPVLCLDSMHDFWLGFGLGISPTRTEIAVCNARGSPSLTHWQPEPAAVFQLRELGLVLHKSGSLSHALKRLAQKRGEGRGEGGPSATNEVHTVDVPLAGSYEAYR